MAAISFDTLAPARKLAQAGFPAGQAQDTSAAFADVMGRAPLVNASVVAVATLVKLL
jgi:hypothetical protein